MGNRSSLLLREEEIAQIQEETGCKFVTLIHFRLSCVDKFQTDIWVPCFYIFCLYFKCAMKCQSMITKKTDNL